MNLTFSPEQAELAEAVRRFSKEEITPERLNAWEKLPGGIDPVCWSAISDLGWLGIGLPQSVGGSGLGLVDVACLLAECTRGLIPSVVITAIRGAYALAHIDGKALELPSLATGHAKITLAIDEQSASAAPALRACIEGEGSSARLSGEKWFVPHGTVADLLIVAAAEEGGISLVLAERAAAEVVPLRSFVSDDTQAIVRFDRAPIVRRLCGPGDGAAVLNRLRRHQTALALAEMVGGMDAVLEMTVAYVKEREQFGQKIAVFQAVQHQVADMATSYTAGRHLAWQAITRIAESSDQAIDLPAAAAFVGQAFKQLTLRAHHLHGGAGFVVEHPLHYYSERAQSLCIRYTPEAPALAEVASTLLD